MMATGIDDDPKSSTTVIVGLIGTLGLLALIVLAQVLFYGQDLVESERKIVAVKPQELLDLQAEQLRPIAGYRMIDVEKGVVGIPISNAMKHYVRELKSGELPPTMQVTESGPAKPQPAEPSP